MDDCNDVVMILDTIGRSSSTDSTTSQLGAGSRSHDLGDASVMICLITSIGGALNDDSSDVKPRMVLLSTQPSASRQADSSRQMFSIFPDNIPRRVSPFPLTTCGRGVHVGLSYAVGDLRCDTVVIDCYPRRSPYMNSNPLLFW